MSAQLETMALALANKYAEMQEAGSPRGSREARAEFRGVCVGVHAAGVGMTPDAVYGVVQGAWKTVGPRPAASASNAPRKQWAASMIEAIVMNQWFM